MRHDISDRTRNAVSIQLIISGVLGALLLLQPESLAILRSRLTGSQILEIALMVLTVAVFLRREELFKWLDRALIVVLVGVQMVLFASDSELLIVLAASMGLPIVLAVGTVLILLCLRIPFSVGDRFLVFALMGSSLWQLLVHQDVLLPIIGPTSTWINVVLVLTILIITLVLLNLSAGNAHQHDEHPHFQAPENSRSPVNGIIPPAYLLRVIFAILAVINVTLLEQQKKPVLLPVNMNWTLACVCAFTAFYAFVSLLTHRKTEKKARAALFYSVLLLTISMISLIVQISILHNMTDLLTWYDGTKKLVPLPIVNARILTAMPQITLLFVWVTIILFALTLVFIFVSCVVSLARLVRHKREDEIGPGVLQQGKETWKHILLLTVIITGLFLQELFGLFEYSFLLYQDEPSGIAIFSSSVLLIVLAVLALGLLWKFLRRSYTYGTWFWERMSIIVVACVYTLLLFSVKPSESESVLPITLSVPHALDLPPLSTYLQCGLFIVATLLLVTPHAAFRDIPSWLIRLLTGIGCACVLLSFFWPPSLVGAFICLIQGLLLIGRDHNYPATP
jgi:hypothetical protein